MLLYVVVCFVVVVPVDDVVTAIVAVCNAVTVGTAGCPAG